MHLKVCVAPTLLHRVLLPAISGQYKCVIASTRKKEKHMQMHLKYSDEYNSLEFILKHQQSLQRNVPWATKLLLENVFVLFMKVTPRLKGPLLSYIELHASMMYHSSPSLRLSQRTPWIPVCALTYIHSINQSSSMRLETKSDKKRHVTAAFNINTCCFINSE